MRLLEKELHPFKFAIPVILTYAISAPSTTWQLQEYGESPFPNFTNMIKNIFLAAFSNTNLADNRIKYTKEMKRITTNTYQNILNNGDQNMNNDNQEECINPTIKKTSGLIKLSNLRSRGKQSLNRIMKLLYKVMVQQRLVFETKNPQFIIKDINNNMNNETDDVDNKRNDLELNLEI